MRGKKVGLASDTRIRGRNIHRLLFRRSKHRKQVRQSAQQRNKQKKLIGVEFPGCYNSPPPTEDVVPISRTIPGEGRGEKREMTKNSTPPTMDTAPCQRRTYDEKLPQRNDNVERRGHGDTRRRNDNSMRRSRKHSHSEREGTRQED